MENYKFLLGKVWDELKPKGFIKKGSNFLLLRSGNYAIINFQKSQTSTTLSVSFTINIGIYSGSVGRALQQSYQTDKPDFIDCHWKQRIGLLLDTKSDTWWHIDSSTDTAALTNEILDTVSNVALPVLLNYLPDTALEVFWASANAQGITELERCIYLTALLKYYNKSELADTIKLMTEQANGKSYRNALIRHFSYLEHVND